MRYLANSAQVVCATLIAIGTPAGAQDGAPGHPRSRGDLGRAITDSLTRILTVAHADSAFPGAYVIVGDSRGVIARAGVGRIDWSRRSARPDQHTLWDLASLTKVIATTTAAAQLVEQHRVELDAPVQRYLPGWTGPGKEQVTVRHLLTHTSGLPAFRGYDRQTHDPDSLAALLFATELEHPPGERMVYSDIGAFVLGRIVEAVSGERLDRYFARHVAAPLRLRDSRFNPPASLRWRIAPTEVDTSRGGLVWGKVHDERAYYLGGIAAHAGLFGSAYDLARFARMMLRGGSLDGARILNPGTVATFTVAADPSFSNRALGWQKPERNTMQFRTSAAWAGASMSPSAYGHTGFTGTSIAIDPELDLFVVLLTNRVNPTRNNSRITAVRTQVADAVVTLLRGYREPTSNPGSR